MAFGKRIIQDIELRGDQVKAEFAAINKEGKAAFDGIAKSGQAPAEALRNIEQSAKRVGTSFKDFLGKLTGSGLGRFGSDAKGAAKGIGDLGNEVDNVAPKLTRANNAGVQLAGTLRLLGRAAGIRELSLAGKQANALGRAFAVAAPVLFAAALGKVASSATEAASATAQMAAENKTSTAQFQELVSAEHAIGGGAEDANKGFKGLSDLIKETASNTKESEQKFRDLSGQLQESKDKAFELGRGFADIARQAEKSFKDITRSQEESAISFNQSLRSLQQERADLISGKEITAAEQKKRRLAALDEQEANLRRKHALEEKKAAEDLAEAKRKQIEDTRKLNLELEQQAKKEKEITTQLAAARVEAEQNKTALDKLGISATGTNGKLKTVPDTILQIADALKGITDDAQRLGVENDLVAAGLDRKLLPALRQGAEAYKTLVAEGDKIRPPFTAEQIATADKFGIAIGQLGNAFGALKDAIGLAIAPVFTEFFTALAQAVVNARQPVMDFLGIVGSALKPVLEGIGIIIATVIVPAFQGFAQILSLVNSVFGTSVTGPQLFAAVLLTVAAALLPIPAIILGAVAAFSTFKATLQEHPILLGALVAAISFLALAFGGIPVAIAAVILAVGFVASKWDELKAVGATVAQSLQASWESFKTWFASTWAGQIIQTIKDIIGWFAKLGQARDSSGGGVGGGGAEGFAGGGPIRGRGTSTSDSIPIWASNDEFMVQAKAAKYYGRTFMNAVNNLRFPRNLIRGFAHGGAISMGHMPTMGPIKLAKGGPVPSPRAMRPLSLTFPGFGSFEDLLAPEDVADKMIRLGFSKQLKSGGRKPSSYGGR